MSVCIVCQQCATHGVMYSRTSSSQWSRASGLLIYSRSFSSSESQSHVVYIQICSCASGCVCLCIWLEFAGVRVHACVRPGVHAWVLVCVSPCHFWIHSILCLPLAPGDVGGADGSCTPWGPSGFMHTWCRSVFQVYNVYVAVVIGSVQIAQHPHKDIKHETLYGGMQGI